MDYTIKEERLTAEEYIEFLKHTDLGSQYPKERFCQRIGTLVNGASIGLLDADSDPNAVNQKDYSVIEGYRVADYKEQPHTYAEEDL